MKKKVIISGLNGQLGQYMAKYLLDNHPDIRIIGTLRSKSFDNQTYLFDRSRVTIEIMDLCDMFSVENLIIKYRPDYFINTAASAYVAESWLAARQHYENNLLGVVNQLEAIRTHSPNTRYFNMGTSEEFGATEKSFLDESSPLAPLSPYGSSKCAARFAVRVWRKSYNLYALQGWTFNFESKIRGIRYLTKKSTDGVARIAKAMKDGQTFEPLFLGNLDSNRSWQFAADVARGVWAMLNQEIYNKDLGEIISNESARVGEGQTYNPIPTLSKHIKEYVLSAPDVNSVRSFVEKSFGFAGIQGCWVGEGLKETYQLASSVGTENPVILVAVDAKFFRPADVTYLHGNASAIKRDLGWFPEVSFHELVKEMVTADLAAVGITIP